jgi:hypothetical protein
VGQDGYYDEVIAAIRETQSILIFGPGEAKGELRKRLERDDLGGRIVAVEAVDKMTDRQTVSVLGWRGVDSHRLHHSTYPSPRGPHREQKASNIAITGGANGLMGPWIASVPGDLLC